MIGSCADFGSSGSGIVREWKEYNNQNPSFDFPNEKQKFYQYSFVGPLSMSKGCDLSTEIEPRLKDETNDDGERDPIFIYRGEQDCLLQGQAQLDQRVVFRFCTLRLRGGECQLTKVKIMV